MAPGGKVDPTSAKLMFSFMQTLIGGAALAMLIILVIQTHPRNFRCDCTPHPIHASVSPEPMKPCGLRPPPNNLLFEIPPHRRAEIDASELHEEVDFEKTNEVSN